MAESIQDSYMRDSSAKNWEQEIQERLEATEGWFKRWEAISREHNPWTERELRAPGTDYLQSHSRMKLRPFPCSRRSKSTITPRSWV